MIKMEEWREEVIKKTDNPLLIESIYNTEYELWEVSLNGELLQHFVTEEEASELVSHVYLAFEFGFVNGIQLAMKQPGEAQKSLLARGFIKD